MWQVSSRHLRNTVVVLVAITTVSTVTLLLKLSSIQWLALPHSELTHKPVVKLLPFVKHKDAFSLLISSAPVSKDVSLHRAYFDDRDSGPEHFNRTIFFSIVSITIFKNNWILGCGVNGKEARKEAADFKVRPPKTYRFRGGGRKFFEYESMYIDCYDLNVNPGDRPFLKYKTSNDSSPIIVESEYPVVLPAKSRAKAMNRSDPYNITVVSCIKANSLQAPFLGENIRYQQTLGVDHVSILAMSTFIIDGGLKSLLINHQYVIEYFVNGYITVDVWKQWYNQDEIRYWSEILRKLSCSYAYRGTYDYSMPIDTDDFLTPHIPDQKNIKYYLLKYCYAGNIGSCMLKWVWYRPDCGLNEIPSDGNATKALKTLKHHYQRGCAHCKSIHKLDVLLEASMHTADKDGDLMPGYKAFEFPIPICTMSHMRYMPDSDRRKKGFCE